MSIITAFLVVLNFVVTLTYFHKDEPREFLFYPYQLRRGKGIRGWLYAHFSHGGWAHFLFNMIALYSFGQGLEMVSPTALIVTYVVSGLAADAAVMLMRSNDPHYACLGASGSISGVVLTTIVFFPGLPINLLLIPIDIPGALFAVLYIGLSFYLMRVTPHGISHEAHLGGAIAGLISGAIMAPLGLSPLLDYFIGFLR
ncbi:MAG: rhomboid family intramembrane serine protease [Leptospiraceae bacterium]|nr:rhomboid family intramembrane serine protease [Leptospiraceae bacterium]